MYRPSIAAVLLSAILIALSMPAARGDDTQPVVRIAVADLAILSNFSLEFADAQGYFKDEGLNVQIIPFKSGTVASQAVISGQVDFAWNGIDLAANLRAHGKDVKAVGTASSASGLQLVASRDITTVEQLRGKNLGVGGLGSGTDITMEYILFQHGLLRGTYNVIPVGLSQTFIAAFQNHQIDGGVTSEPWTTYIVKQGLGHVLVDMDSVDGTKAVYGGPYGITALWGTTAYIDQNQPVVRKLLRAIMRANAYVRSVSFDQLKPKIPKVLIGDDPTIAYEGLQKFLAGLSTTPVISIQEAQRALSQDIRVVKEINDAVLSGQLHAADLLDMRAARIVAKEMGLPASPE